MCSAHPTLPLFATGRVGEAQLQRLERRLSELSDSSLCRVVLVHHPIIDGTVSDRRALLDADALRGVLARTGADLVLHGHGHRTVFGEVPGPKGPIPVVGVRSSSDVGLRQGRRAQYHVYEIERAAPGADRPFRITTRVRGYDPGSGAFRAEGISF